MKQIRTVGISEARRKFSALVKDVKTKSRIYIISRYGEPRLVLLPLSEHQKYKRWMAAGIK